MSLHIFLHSYPLGQLSIPVRGNTVRPVAHWAANCIASGREIYVPEIADYELRRELLRAKKTNSVRELDVLKMNFNFLPLTSDAMLLAAGLWAQSRNQAVPTADPKALDVDVILAAQALTTNLPKAQLVVATSNVAHISRFVSADIWSNIS